MKQKNTWFFLLPALVIMPVLVFAAAPSSQSPTLLNPLPVAQQLYCPTAVCDLRTMFLLILRDLLQIIPVCSVLFIIVGGYQMIMSSGNEERLARAKRTIVWAVLGLVIALLSFSIVAIVQNVLGS